MPSPKTVTLFLMDGTPNGPIKCSLDNWVGKVFLIPRTELNRSKSRPDLQKTGLYFLIGSGAEKADYNVYVGQARRRQNGQGVLGRVIEHARNGDQGYFTHAIVVITSDISFGPTEISYLENAFYRQAQMADRVCLVNGNIPPLADVSEQKEAALEEFIAYTRIAIGSLGYRFFDAVDDAKTVEASEPLEPSWPNVEPLLYLKASGAIGRGRQTSDGFVVLAGSIISRKVRNQPFEPAEKSRKKLAGRISETGELIRDTLFTSPSAAAVFLTGYSINGRIYWKDENGVSLRELEESEFRDFG